MTRVFREEGSPDFPVCEWDVVSFCGCPRVAFRAPNGDERLSSYLVDDQGLFLRDTSVVAKVGPGSRLRVASGKTYVLVGERRPFPNHPQCSLVREPEPDPPRRSWILRLLRAGS